jgi:fucose 4-O-acetylase-like acetyltransferase
MLLCSGIPTTMWVRVIFAWFITAAFFSLCIYLETYIKLDTVQSKYLNRDVFVVIFYSFVTVFFSDFVARFYRGPTHCLFLNMETC